MLSLQVPRNIAELTAITVKRYRISNSGYASTLANIINVSGGIIEDFPLSTSSVWRAGKRVISEAAESIKSNYQLAIKDTYLTLHFDGKSVKEYTGNVKVINERLAVLVSSYKAAPQLLGVPSIPSSSGSDQEAAIEKLIVKWGILPNVIALCFDTTSSNTGKWRGACIMIEHMKGMGLLWLACRRHVYEIHIKHISKAVTGKTTLSPGENLFKRLQEAWIVLKEGIDYDNLVKFDWDTYSGAILVEQAQIVQQFCRRCLVLDTFPREDYRELCELTFVWLGGVVPNGFQFQYPGAWHYARFMMQAIYYLKLQLLSRHITFMTPEEHSHVIQMSEFIGLFHTFWFLRCALASAAPFLDLQAIHQMRQYRQFRAVTAEACITSQANHGWYLTQQLVVFSLVDDDLPQEERRALAMALAKTKRPKFFPPGKPIFPRVTDNFFWPNIGTMPNLSSLVGTNSWLIFERLGISIVETEWLNLEVDQWESLSGYLKFRKFVRGLTVVNDPAERAIKLIQDFVECSHDEELRQDTMLAVSDHRKKFPKATK